MPIQIEAGRQVQDITEGLDQCFDEACGAFEVRLNPIEIDCENSQLFVDLEIRAAGPNAGFNLGNQNYRFTFDETVIANPMIDQELVISGQVQEGGTNNFYNPHTTTGSVSNIISYNVTLAFGEGYPVGMDWVGVGRLVFDILDGNSCANFEWNTDDPADFPNTIIVGVNGNNLFYEVQPDAYLDNTVCFDECQTTSVEEVADDQIRIFPSVTAGPLTIAMDGDALNQNWEMQIVNPLGQVIKTQQLDAGQTRQRLDLSTYASGSYQILLRSTNHFKVATVIKSE
ncbi:MAG: T9SS type A sorting domain-containing protein [Bacteroidota bacterium]